MMKNLIKFTFLISSSFFINLYSASSQAASISNFGTTAISFGSLSNNQIFMVDSPDEEAIVNLMVDATNTIKIDYRDDLSDEFVEFTSIVQIALNGDFLVNELETTTITELGNQIGGKPDFLISNVNIPGTFTSTESLPVGDYVLSVLIGYIDINGTIDRDTSSPFSGSISFSVAVPEPLTILGTAAALGFGTAFKRKLNKIKKIT